MKKHVYIVSSIIAVIISGIAIWASLNIQIGKTLPSEPCCDITYYKEYGYPFNIMTYSYDGKTGATQKVYNQKNITYNFVIYFLLASVGQLAFYKFILPSSQKQTQ